jgi:hypothetical protein
LPELGLDERQWTVAVVDNEASRAPVAEDPHCPHVVARELGWILLRVRVIPVGPRYRQHVAVLGDRRRADADYTGSGVIPVGFDESTFEAAVGLR